MPPDCALLAHKEYCLELISDRLAADLQLFALDRQRPVSACPRLPAKGTADGRNEGPSQLGVQDIKMSLFNLQ